MCRHRMTGALTPVIRASVTKSYPFTVSTSPRIIRANRAHTVSSTARMIATGPGSIITTTTSASRIVGNPSAASVIRISSASAHPPQ